MSRNPILNDRAFGTAGDGRSPSEEWAAAQGGDAGSTFGSAASGAWQHSAPGASVGQPGIGQPYGAGYQQPTAAGPIVGAGTGSATMTLAGVSSAGLIMFVFLVVGALFGWSQVTVSDIGRDEFGRVVQSANLQSPGILIGALLVGFVLAIVTAFKPAIARFTAIPYALLEGVVLGLISHLYEVESSGIVLQAILATFAVFAIMLLLYGLRVLRATPRFTKGVIAATFGVLAMYAIGWIISLFSHGAQPFWANSGVMGIGISIVIVVIAAMNLILDFDFIERGSQNNLPSYMNWYAAFGLVVTMVWLYLEILRLLSKLRD